MEPEKNAPTPVVIKITPAMIEAGVRDLEDSWDAPESIVKARLISVLSEVFGDAAAFRLVLELEA